MAQPEKTQGQLVRSLGLFSAFILTVSSVIGSGVYKKVAPMSSELLSADLVLTCWVLAGLITLCGTLSNAEVAGLLADSGGEYVYFRKIYNKFFAFLFGWTAFTVIRSAAVASIAYVFAHSFNALVPLPELPASWAQISLGGVFTPFDNFGVKTLTVLLIVGLSYNNYIGLKFGEGLSKTVTIIVVVSIFLVIVLGLTLGGGSWANFTTPATGYVHHAWTEGAFIQSIFAALLAAFWAYEGWSATGYIGGEIKNPNRNLPLALVLGVSFVMLVYISINFTYLYVLPIDEIIAAHKSQNTIAAVVVIRHFLGEAGALFIALLILLTTFGCTNTTLLGPPRLYYAMAKEGMFFKSASYIHPRYNTPSKAIFIQAVWSSILVFSGSFDQLTDMLVFAAFIFYGATTLGVFVLRVKMRDVPRPYKAWGYPVVPAIFILFCVALIAITMITKPREALIGLALMGSGLPFYWYWTRSGARSQEPGARS
ncbi:basic amino acid/polyamine antiporter, APA family [Chryseolinea serpens]|uniref:Basic amino acid/polyamine antiporter, APA family n=1 Tax=Chryseolinea serpens TaxID=947013 RepID=A0A1M5TGE7_9BACT|nr:amino acid permease [Chryseolinea serpens]SHH49433.1 basic amino acid/polyamine antiporter, APA family [Chryseolinea serpens]